MFNECFFLEDFTCFGFFNVFWLKNLFCVFFSYHGQSFPKDKTVLYEQWWALRQLVSVCLSYRRK